MLNLDKLFSINKKIFVCDDTRYDLPVNVYGKLCFDTKKFLSTPGRYKLVVLTGGEDVSPALYGHITSKFTGEVNLNRDAKDLLVAYCAIRSNIPLLGICRGAQLINILAGGSMIQHCDKHTVWHNMQTEDGRVMEVSSTHHQMMVLPKDTSSYKLLGWASPKRSTYYFISSRKRPSTGPELEPECVFFPKFSALALQYHPEYMNENDASFTFAHELIEKYLGIKKEDKQNRDSFISLPKLRTENRDKIDFYLQKSMSEGTKKEYSNRLFIEEFMLNKIRKLRSQLIPFGQASHLAKIQLEEILTSSNKTQTENAVRASGASE